MVFIIRFWGKKKCCNFYVLKLYWQLKMNAVNISVKYSWSHCTLQLHSLIPLYTLPPVDSTHILIKKLPFILLERTMARDLSKSRWCYSSVSVPVRTPRTKTHEGETDDDFAFFVGPWPCTVHPVDALVTIAAVPCWFYAALPRFIVFLSFTDSRLDSIDMLQVFNNDAWKRASAVGWQDVFLLNYPCLLHICDWLNKPFVCFR